MFWGIMFAIEKNLHIAAPIEQVWAALTDPVMVDAWMLDDTIQLDVRLGGRYALFAGQTTGTFTHIEPPYVLEYTWRQPGWPPTNSLVRWELKRGGAGTFVHLVHSQLPSKAERDSHEEGWDVYWLQPMVEWLEANTR